MAQAQKCIHLDTHVVCWLYAGLVQHFSETARNFIEENDLAISPWVLSEMQMLFERGVITLPALAVFEDLERRLGLSLAKGQSLDLVKASLPLAWASDPFDRMIVAHALVDEAPLISKDAHLHSHFKQVVW